MKMIGERSLFSYFWKCKKES